MAIGGCQDKAIFAQKRGLMSLIVLLSVGRLVGQKWRRNEAALSIKNGYLLTQSKISVSTFF